MLSAGAVGRRAPAAVIFDMDGTLFDSTVVVPDAYISTVLACGGPQYDRGDIIAAYTLGPRSST